MHRVFKCLWAFGLAALVSLSVGGATFRLEDGDIYEGNPVVPPDDDGLVIQRAVGGFTDRISWNRFDQETLKEMLKDPRLRNYAEPFIDLTPEQFQSTLPRRNNQPVTIRAVPRLERPENPGFFSALTTSGGLLFGVVFYLANVFAAYEVAVFKRRSPLLVCGVSLVMPVLGQIVFLSLPTLGGVDAVVAEHEPSSGHAAEATSAEPPAAASNLGLAAAKEASSGKKELEGSVFKKSEFNFDRRFFETKLAGFFRVTLAEPERSLSIVVRGGGKEIVAARISRISFNEISFQLPNGSESAINFGDIQEVLIRKK